MQLVRRNFEIKYTTNFVVFFESHLGSFTRSCLFESSVVHFSAVRKVRCKLQ